MPAPDAEHVAASYALWWLRRPEFPSGATLQECPSAPRHALPGHAGSFVSPPAGLSRGNRFFVAA